MCQCREPYQSQEQNLCYDQLFQHMMILRIRTISLISDGLACILMLFEIFLLAILCFCFTYRIPRSFQPHFSQKNIFHIIVLRLIC